MSGNHSLHRNFPHRAQRGIAAVGCGTLSVLLFLVFKRRLITTFVQERLNIHGSGSKVNYLLLYQRTRAGTHA